MPKSDDIEILRDNRDIQKRDNKKLFIFGLLALSILVLWFVFGDSLNLASLAERENELRAYRDSNPLLIFGIAFVLYVVVAGLALPGAAGMSLVYAWFFGFWPALVLINLASTLGATFSFLLSRYLLRDSVQSRFQDRLRLFNDNLESDGAFYLFTLRLIPAVPFFIINLVMGLTKMNTWTFWWISQIGMLPGTVVFVYAGSSVPRLETLAETGVRSIVDAKVLIAFILLGLFPLAVKRAVQFFKQE